MTQYVKCRFAADDKRKYTYHNDGDPVAPGDMVRVETKDGAKTVEVVAVGDEKPNFKTKPVLGKAEAERADEAANAPAEPQTEPDAPVRGLGDNAPPPYDPDALEAFQPKVQDFADAAGAWLDAGEIADEEQAGKLNDFIVGCRGLFRQIEDRRKADKQPHLDAGKAVDAAYKRLTDPLQRAADRVKPLLTAYAAKKAEAQERERQAAIEKARREAEEARKAAEAADSRHDVAGESEAAEALKAAEKAEREAERMKASGAISSATGGGRTAALRTYYRAEITGMKQAVLWALDNHAGEVEDMLLRLANAAKRHDSAVEIPGVHFHAEKKVA